MTSSRMSRARIGTLAVAAGVVFLASCARLGLTLAPAAISIDEGETEEVTATLTRDGVAQEGVTVEFESGDESVASVSPVSAPTNAAGEAQATVTGGSAGNTAVTATAEGESLSAVVTVTEPGRQIEIVGTSGDITNWHVTIDGVAQDPPRNPHEITVGPGDVITWRVEGGFHGVGFFGQANAEAILEFDPAVGRPRSASPGVLDAGWFGTEGISSGILARATVRAGVASTELDFTCVVHGSSDIAVNNMRGKLVIP